MMKVLMGQIHAGMIGLAIGLGSIVVPFSMPAIAALETQSLDVQRLYEQGVEQAATEQYAAAIASFSEAIRLEPTFPEAYSARGRAQVLAGDRRAAFQDLEQAAQLHMGEDQLEEALADMNLMIELLEMGIRRRPSL